MGSTVAKMLDRWADTEQFDQKWSWNAAGLHRVSMQQRTIAHNGSGGVMDAERPGSAVWDGKSKRARMASPFWLPQALTDQVCGAASTSVRASSRGAVGWGRR